MNESKETDLKDMMKGLRDTHKQDTKPLTNLMSLVDTDQLGD